MKHLSLFASPVFERQGNDISHSLAWITNFVATVSKCPVNTDVKTANFTILCEKYTISRTSSRKVDY